MTLEELYKAIAEDFTIDQSDLGGEAIRTTKIWQKYVTLLSQEKMKMELYDAKKRKLINEKRKYYTGNASPEVYKEKPFNERLKTDSAIQKALDADDDIINLDLKIASARQKVELLENCLDECKRRGFGIKSAIDWHKFMSGM